MTYNANFNMDNTVPSNLVRHIRLPEFIPEVTFCIVTFGELKELQNLLLSIATSMQDTPYCVFIYSNYNERSEISYELTELYNKGNIQLLCISPRNTVMGACRNVLIEDVLTFVGKSKYIVFCDSDAVFLDFNWFSYCKKAFNENTRLGLLAHDGGYWESYSPTGGEKRITYTDLDYEIDLDKFHVASSYFFCVPTRILKENKAIRFDPTFCFWFDDDDFALQILSHGYSMGIIKGSALEHIGHKGQEMNPIIYGRKENIAEARQLLFEKWKDYLYNKNMPLFSRLFLEGDYLKDD